MASRYWVGGGSSTNWNATGNTNWSDTSGGANNASVPIAGDDVFFDANSGTGDSTISAHITVRSLNCTGYTGTITHNSSSTLSIGYTSAGAGNIALKLVSGMTYTFISSTTSDIRFVSTSGTVQTIDWGGVSTPGDILFDGAGGSWQYVSQQNGTADISLTRGTLDINGQDCSWGTFSSSNSNTRTLTLGASVIMLTGTGTIWDTSTTTDLTFSGENATIKLTGTGSSARTISAGSLANFPSVWVSAGSGTVTFTNVTNVENLDFTGFSGTCSPGTITVRGNLTLASAMTFGGTSTMTFAATSGTKVITTNGKTIARPLTFNGVGGTWQIVGDITVTDTVTLTNGTLDLNGNTLFCSAPFVTTSGNARTITNGMIIITSLASTVWNANGTNLTITNVIVEIAHSDNQSKNFAGGGATYPEVIFSGDNILLFGSNTFEIFRVNNAGHPNGLKVEAGSTQTVTEVTTNGSSGNLAKLLSTTPDSAAILSKVSGDVVVDYMSIKDSTATGGATWTAFNSINEGGNTGWIFAVVQCSLSSAATLSSSSEVIYTGSAPLTVTSSQIVTGTIILAGISDLIVVGSINVNGVATKTGSCSVSSISALTATGELGPSLNLVALSTLNISASIIVGSGQLNLTGSGGKVTVSAVTFRGIVGITASSNITSNAVITTSARAVLTSIGSDFVDGVVILSGKSTLNNSSSLTTSGQGIFSGNSLLSSSSSLTPLGGLIHAGQADIQGASLVTPSSSLTLTSSSTLASSVIFSTSGNISLLGPLMWIIEDGYARVGDITHNKSGSIKLTHDGVSTNAYIYTENKTLVSPSTQYIASIYVYNPGTIAGTGYPLHPAGLQVVVYDENESQVGSEQIYISSRKTNGWERLILPFTTSADADSVEIRLRIYDRGSIWFDSLSLRETSAEYDTSFIEGANGPGYSFSSGRNSSTSIREPSAVFADVGGVL